MKVKIGKFEIEGTPDEIAELIAKEGEDIKPATTVVVQKRWIEPIAKQVHPVKRGQTAELLAKIFRKNPELMNCSEKDIGNAYMKECGFHSYNVVNFPKSIRKAMKLARRKEKFMEIATHPHYKRIELRGKKPYSIQKITDMLRQNPSLAQKPINEIYKAYIGHDALAGSHFRDNLNKAMEQLNQTQAKPERVRIFQYGYIKRSLIDELLRRMPDNFTMRDMLRAASTQAGISPTDTMRWRALNKSIHSALSKRSDIKSIRRITEKGIRGTVNVYEKTKALPSVTSALGVKASGDLIDEPAAFKQPADFEPMIIKKETLDMIVENHTSFGADVFIGLKSKTGMLLKENEAVYAFRYLLENFAAFAAAYPHKRFGVTGQGRWKVIEIR